LFGFVSNDRLQRLGIIGGAVVLLLVIVAALAYRIYDERVARPGSTILSVSGQKFSLSYYADRLGPFIRANAGAGTSTTILEEQLLNKMEEEAVALELAKEKGIALGRAEVEAFIGSQLGAQPNTPSFDTLYRNQLRTLGMSDSNYRRLKQAELATAKLIEAEKTAVGTNGEQLTLRTIIVASEDEGNQLKVRIQAGEDMGTLAQTASLDLESRQQDGLMLPEPIELLPENVRKAAEDQNAGAFLGPVDVQGNWWIFRIEAREPTDYNESQKDQLSQTRIAALIDQRREELRAAGKIKRSLDASDVSWAEKRVS
jgi:parvulin-like peptidyl-prolyl isomerase